MLYDLNSNTLGEQKRRWKGWKVWIGSHLTPQSGIWYVCRVGAGAAEKERAQKRREGAYLLVFLGSGDIEVFR